MGNFCLLIETLKVERVEELVSGGSPDVSYMDNEKRSPLHAAAFVGNSDIVEILIDQVVVALIDTFDMTYLPNREELG